MKNMAALLGLVTLTACGADGEPVRPSVDTTVSVGTNGVNVSTGVGMQVGPVSVRVGL